MAVSKTCKHEDARVRAELEGKNSYGGAPCKKNPDHIREDGTTLRDTIKYGCLKCLNLSRRKRNTRRRNMYSKQQEEQA